MPRVAHRVAGCCVLLLLLLAQRNVLAAEHVTVTTQAQGRAVSVRAAATLYVPHALIWETLTDYSRLAQFIPSMQMSRLIERRGHTALVEQQGTARFLAFSHPIRVLVEAIEQPPSSIGVRIVEGNLKQLSGQYRIEPLPAAADGFVLRWEGIVEPQLAVPGFVGARLLRANIASQFLGMVEEIERRHAHTQ